MGFELNQLSALMNLERGILLSLPKKIVENLPPKRLAAIRLAIADLTEVWKQKNATPDAEGFVTVPVGNGLLSALDPVRVTFDDCPAWQIGIAKGFVSPVSLLSELYFEWGDELSKRVELLVLYEYFAVVLNDHGASAPANEFNRYYAWMAESLVGWLIHLRGESGWSGVEPVASIYYRIFEERSRVEFARIRKIYIARMRQTPKETIARIASEARGHFSKNKKLSINKIADLIKLGDATDDLPKTSQIRSLIKEHCPEIPRQSAGRKPGSRKKK